MTMHLIFYVRPGWTDAHKGAPLRALGEPGLKSHAHDTPKMRPVADRRGRAYNANSPGETVRAKARNRKLVLSSTVGMYMYVVWYA